MCATAAREAFIQGVATAVPRGGYQGEKPAASDPQAVSVAPQYHRSNNVWGGGYQEQPACVRFRWQPSPGQHSYQNNHRDSGQWIPRRREATSGARLPGTATVPTGVSYQNLIRRPQGGELSELTGELPDNNIHWADKERHYPQILLPPLTTCHRQGGGGD